jgi:hypothetical protein
MKWLRGLGFLFAMVGGYCLYWTIANHIEARAHSNPLRPEFYVYGAASVVFTALSLLVFWPWIKWYSIPLTLLLEAVVVVAMVAKFFLPFP